MPPPMQPLFEPKRSPMQQLPEQRTKLQLRLWLPLPMQRQPERGRVRKCMCRVLLHKGLARLVAELNDARDQRLVFMLL